MPFGEEKTALVSPIHTSVHGAILALALLAVSGMAGAETLVIGPPSRVEVPKLELRAFGGIALGAGAAGSILDHRLRLELSEGWVPGKANGHYTEGAVLARIAGTPSNALWVRAGFQRIAMTLSCYDRSNVDDDARAFDVGAAYRHRSPAGHLFVAELGAESLRRDQALGCSDSAVDARSTGVRVGVLGQLALGHSIGLFGRLGLRTADHLLEISILPELFGGIAFEM